MKDKVLSSNAYTLITIGSGMVLEGTNIRLGITYCVLGMVLFTFEIYVNHLNKDEEKKDETKKD